jgi:hypothetical protein
MEPRPALLLGGPWHGQIVSMGQHLSVPDQIRDDLMEIFQPDPLPTVQTRIVVYSRYRHRVGDNAWHVAVIEQPVKPDLRDLFDIQQVILGLDLNEMSRIVERKPA